MGLGTTAFYILFAEQITSPDWPAKVCQNAGVGPQGDQCVDPRNYSDGLGGNQSGVASTPRLQRGPRWSEVVSSSQIFLQAADHADLLRRPTPGGDRVPGDHRARDGALRLALC